MKFVNLHSRGGNYLVVASNIAWLRTAENGQTSVGMVGGQPLLVVGSIEEVAAIILADAALENDPAPTPQDVAPPRPTAALPSVPSVEGEPVTIAEVDDPEPEPAAFKAEEIDPEPELKPEREPVSLSTRAAALVLPRSTGNLAANLWERPVAPAATGLKIKAGSQRMMGMLE